PGPALPLMRRLRLLRLRTGRRRVVGGGLALLAGTGFRRGLRRRRRRARAGRCRIAGTARVEIALRCGLFGDHADPVLDILDPRRRVGDVLGAMLHPSRRHLALQYHAALRAAHLDVGGIDDRVVAQTLVHVLQDALVGPGIATGAASTMAALPLGGVRPLPAPGCLREAAAPVRMVMIATGGCLGAALHPAFAAVAVAPGQIGLRVERAAPARMAAAGAGIEVPAAVPGEILGACVELAAAVIVVVVAGAVARFG